MILKSYRVWFRIVDWLISLLPKKIRPVARKAHKFALVGGVATILNYGLYTLLFTVFDVYYIISAATGYTMGVLFSFAFNLKWTFKYTKGSIYTLIGYLLVYAVSYFISIEVFLRFIVEVAGVHPLVGNILAIGVSTATNFLGCNYFVFNDEIGKRRTIIVR